MTMMQFVKRALTWCAVATMVASVRAGELEALAKRVSPKLEGRVIFRIEPARKDISVAPSGQDKIAIAAPNTRLAAAGLGCYLRTVAKAHWSWCGDRLTGEMPAPNRAYTFRPAAPHSLAYNYCTLSYTMAFWDAAAWRAELDRLALYGFEYFLVQAGLPQVWAETLRELGYPEERIAAFIPDEAAAAWWNMGNLEGLGGPLSAQRVAENAELGREIVAHAKALGLKPILQGFTGLLPHDLPDYLSKADFPDAQWVNQGQWVDGFVRPTLLVPSTEAFAKIAEIWYRNLFKVYGVTAADAFGGDLFHEGGQVANLDVTACARAVQGAQQKASPGAIWMIQAWHGNPREALLKGLDPRYAMVEALVYNQAEGHHYSRRFQNIPWLWCELLNFGGNHGFYGGVRPLADLGALTEQPNADTFAGFGLLSEGLETNPLFYDLFTCRFFMPRSAKLGEYGLDTWLADYALRRYGLANTTLVRALHLLADSVYAPAREQEGCTESVYCARPSWGARKASTWSSGEQYYPPAATRRAAELFAAVAKRSPALTKIETFRYDLIDVMRQALADLGRPLLTLARNDAQAREAFLEAIRLSDELMAFEPRWRLDWCEARTRALAGEAGAKAYRRMITTWSGRRGSLNDYAHRQLAGLFKGYYLRRWEAFFAGAGNLDAQLEAIDRDFLENGYPQATPDLKTLIPTLRRAEALLKRAYETWPKAFRFDTGVAWNLEGRKGTVEMSFDVTEYIKQAGTFEVTFEWTHGGHALKIEQVELFEADQCVAADRHAGYAGIRKQANVYTLKLPKYRTTLADYTLRVTASGDGGGNSAGKFTIERKE